jgi:hypothetical protein
MECYCRELGFVYRVFGFLSKRNDIKMTEFIDYYENKHMSLILSLAPRPTSYKRLYVKRNEELPEAGCPVDFDVITGLSFPDRGAFLAWMGMPLGPGADDQVAEDEAKLLDRTQTTAYVVEELVTSG